MKNILFVNDTTPEEHFGCILTSLVIKQLIRKHANLTKIIPIGYEWDYKDLYTIDTVIINGEGSMHHNTGKVSSIYTLAKVAKRLDKKVYLINTVLEELPEWFNLDTFDDVYVRESLSGDNVVPDACMYKTVKEHPRYGKPIVTDSVIKKVTDHFIDLKNKKDFEYIPFIRDGLDSFDTILEKFSKAPYVITGRFHGVVFALMTRTPFLACGSNTHKIEGLMKDFGLSKYFYPHVSTLFNEINKGLVPKYTIDYDSKAIKQDIENMIMECVK